MHLHCFHGHELPNRYAAGIQMLRTGDAFASLGHRFTFHCAGLVQPRAGILAYYGLRPDSRIELDDLLRAGAAGSRGTALRQWAAALSSRSGDTGGRHVVMPRGNAALVLLPALKALKARPAAERPLIVYEMHNLQFLRQAEKRLGRSLRPEAVVDPKSLVLREREGRAVAAADGVIALTPQILRAAGEVYGPLPPCCVLPSGTDWPEPIRRPGPPRFDVVYAGKLEKRKGAHDLVTAMAHLEGRTLALAGGPPDAAAELRSLAAGLGIGARVSVKGLLPPSAVSAFLAEGRIGVCPLKRGVDSVSDRFTSPMKLLEMMSLGMPIVASDIAPVRALVDHGRQAHLVAAGDPAALAEGIELLLGQPDYGGRLGAAARRRARAFTWPNRARELERFLASLADG